MPTNYVMYSSLLRPLARGAQTFRPGGVAGLLAVMSVGALIMARLPLSPTSPPAAIPLAAAPLADASSSSETVATRRLKFVDQADGGIAIFDEGASVPFEVFAPGGHGFLRGTLRGLARARKLQHDGPGQPFDLLRTADGRLHLADPVTGRKIYLDAFGPTNEAVFEQIMNKRSVRQ